LHKSLLLPAANITSHAILVVGLLVCTRLYSPSQFGEFGIVAAIIQLLGVVSAMRLESALPTARGVGATSALTNVSVSLVCMTAVAAAVVGGIGVFFDLISLPATIAFLVPLGIFLTGLQQIAQQYLLRDKDYAWISAALLAQSLSSTAFQLTSGLQGNQPYGLISGFVFGLICSVAILAFASFRHGNWPHVDFLRQWKFALTHYKRFSLQGTGIVLLSLASAHIPILVIGHIAGAGVAGVFLVAARFASGPVDFLGKGISQTAIGAISSQIRSGQDSGQTIRRLMRLMTLIGVGPILIFGALAPIYCPILLSKEWQQASPMITALVIGTSAQFLTAPVSALFTVLGKQDDLILPMALLGLARVMLLLSGFWFAGIEVGVFGMAIGSFLAYMFMYAKFASAARTGIDIVWQTAREYALFAIPFGLFFLQFRSIEDASVSSWPLVSCSIIGAILVLFSGARAYRFFK
jgi:O-antigen/teichoic acid export membrane protein